jgi:hypothetical protein
MQRNHLISIVAAIFLLGIGSYAACGMEVSDTADELGGATAPPPAHVADAGPWNEPEPAEAAQDLDRPADRAMRANCGTQECGEGELCCRTDGQCYPASCEDCCPAMDDQPIPELDMFPEPGDPAGPPPEPGPVPPGTPAPPPAPGPGPMPGG